jgi:hypothetical protein
VVAKISSEEATETRPGSRCDKRSADEAVFAGVDCAPTNTSGKAGFIKLIELLVVASKGCHGDKVFLEQ